MNNFTASPHGRYLPTSDREVARRLSHAFERAATIDSAPALHDLRAAAVDFVANLKRRGLPPEHVIVAMKDAVRAAHHATLGWQPTLDVGTDEAVMNPESATYRSVFAWCVDAYFDERTS